VIRDDGSSQCGIDKSENEGYNLKDLISERNIVFWAYFILESFSKEAPLNLATFNRRPMYFPPMCFPLLIIGQ
jgi:hypothetical protein